VFAVFSKSTVWQWVLIGTVVSLVAGGLFVYYTASALPPIKEISNRRLAESTKIYDRTGTILLYEVHGDENRTAVSADDIANAVKEATVSIEDDAFYSHPAFDWKSIFRAIRTDILKGHFIQGGSTITQQLAKNAFLTPEKSIIRKIRELILAWQLEKHYTKDQILTLYLNQIPYGNGAYGIESAAKLYFGKHAKDLNISESALLAAIPKAPTYYSPWGNHVSDLKARWKYILQRMHELGYITAKELEYAQNNYPQVLPKSISGIRAPHFVMYVEDYLARKYGEDMLAYGGLKVITSLDINLQTLAETAVANGVARNTQLYGGKNAALVALDPQTGQVLAMVGSADYFNTENDGNFNVITQGLRQPGSAIKPFVYLTAFEGGLTPDTIIWDTPTEFAASNPACPAVVDFTNTNPQCYHPQNFHGDFIGPVRLKDALAQSINIPAVKTLYLAGINNVINTLNNFGITTINDPARTGLSLVLGGGDVKPIELAKAYTVLATEGIKHEIAPVLKVEDNHNNVLEEYRDQATRVVDQQYPRLINNILSDPDLRAPLFQTSLSLTQVPGHQVALKTGTTDNYVDAWAMGYTPDLVAGVWIGNNNRTPLTSKGSSILAAVPLWHEFMAAALKDRPLLTFNKPDPIYSTNPILNGELIKGEQHDILYYLGRVNNPQFINWEEGVKLWLQLHTVDFNKFQVSTYTPTQTNPNNATQNTTSADRVIQITINSPKNGDFISDQINITALVASSSTISKIEVYLNNNLIDSKIGDLGNSYNYTTSLAPSGINTQNILVIRATASNSATSTQQVILFKK
jgi:1A family penicillin-binding protein